MVKRYLDELSIVFLDAAETELKLEYLYGILDGKSTDTIYCVLKRKLYGIVSAGDLKRCKNGAVKINKEFTFLNDWDYAKARKVFQENANFNKIPIVNNDGYLLGDYSRWDDKRWYRCFASVCGREEAKGVLRYIKYEKILLVCPEDRKLEMFEFE